jgi:hypothetical protein
VEVWSIRERELWQSGRSRFYPVVSFTTGIRNGQATTRDLAFSDYCQVERGKSLDSPFLQNKDALVTLFLSAAGRFTSSNSEVVVTRKDLAEIEPGL